MSKFPDVTPNPPILQGKFGAAAFEGTQYEELLDLVYTPVILYSLGGFSLWAEWNEWSVNIFVDAPRSKALHLPSEFTLRTVIEEKYVEVDIGGVLLYSTLV